MSLSAKFKYIFLLTKFSGVYTGLTGLKALPICRAPIQFYYSAVLNIIVFVLHVEMLYGVLSDRPCLYPSFFMAFCWGVIFWSWVKGIHALGNKINIDKIENHWGVVMQTTLWPEIREKEMDLVNSKLTKVAYVTFLTITVPMVLASIFKTFWSGTLFIPSGFAPDYTTIEAPFGIVFIQNFGIFCFNTIWVASETFISLLMNVILAEYKYLETSLKKIVQDYCLNVKEDPCVKETRTALGKWIDFHGKVLKFVRLFEKTFSLVFFGQFLFITIAMCGLLFSTLSGKIPKENTFYCLINIAGNMLLKLQLCRIGDAIAEQSLKMRLVCLSCAGLEFPKDVFNSIKVVNQVIQNKITISMRGLTPLTSDTFRKMVILQYRFYTFMSDTQK